MVGEGGRRGGGDEEVTHGVAGQVEAGATGKWAAGVVEEEGEAFAMVADDDVLREGRGGGWGPRALWLVLG